MKNKKLILSVIFSVLAFFIGNRIGEIFNSAGNMTAGLNALNTALENGTVFRSLHISLKSSDIMWGVFFASAVMLLYIYIAFSRNNFLVGKEHGSAEFSKPSDIVPFRDKNRDNEMIFTMTEGMSINTRKTMRNNNVLVIGGSGSGKTRFFLKPNLMQLHSSYVITDPKGTVMTECGKMFEKAGYVIKTFNTVDFSKSMHYNPFGFIKTEADIKVFVDLMVNSTKEKGERSNDPFWENAEKLLYMALVGAVTLSGKFSERDRHFGTIISMINAMEVREDDETFKNDIDYLFEELELGTEAFAQKYEIKTNDSWTKVPPQPDGFAVSQYKKYKLAAGKTAKSILISCGVRLSPFDVAEVREMTSYDEMELWSLGDRKTVLFIIIDDKVATFNFLCSLMYSQLFKELLDRADNHYGGRLPVHVRCMLDEFANIGQIPDFEKIIAVARSREVSIDVIVQNEAQIEALYDKQAGTIEGNCDTTLFLGTGEVKTMETISKRIGKTTIDHKGSSVSKGQNGSFSQSEQIVGRDLMTADEVGRLDNSECILFIRGLKPFKSKKYKIERHKRYKQLSDYNSENAFDIKEYMQRHPYSNTENAEIPNSRAYDLDNGSFETL